MARLALILANNMAVRNTLSTPVGALLAGQPGLEVAVLTPDPQHAELVEAANRAAGVEGGGGLHWRPLYAGPGAPGLMSGGAGLAARRLAERAAMKLLRPWAGFGNLVYRFNETHGFVGHQQKKGLPPERRVRESLAGNHVEPALGRPMPTSRALLRLLYGIYYNPWYSEPWVEQFLDGFAPQAVVIHHLQNEAVRPWAAAVRRRGLPCLGIVGSWDQPTTKGPLCPGPRRYAVQSQAMAGELARHHGVDPAAVRVTGWPQMDIYRDPAVMQPRDEVLAGLGLAAGRRYILFGANSARLGPHEPGVAAWLGEKAAAGALGPEVSLVIRPHPYDNQAAERFGALHNPPGVVVLPAERGRLEFLTNLLAQAGVVLASAGTLILDAVALDRPAVNLAFDGGLDLGYQQSIRRWGEMDHYRPVIASGGVAVAEDYPGLEAALAGYLADPARDAAGRARLRAEQLDPLDGRASQRLVDLMLAEMEHHG